MFVECIQKALGKEKCLPSAKKKTLAKEFFVERKKKYTWQRVVCRVQKNYTPQKSYLPSTRKNALGKRLAKFQISIAVVEGLCFNLLSKRVCTKMYQKEEI